MPSQIEQGEVAAPVSGYAGAIEHIEDELSRLDLMLDIATNAPETSNSRGQPSRKNGSHKPETNQNGSPDRPGRAGRTKPVVDSARARADLQQQDEAIAARLARSNPGDLPLLRLQRLFDLSPLEYAILIICIAPAVDSRYGVLYAGLNPFGKQCATPGLAARLLAARGEGVARIRESCSAHAPLLRQRLLELRPVAGVYALLETPLTVDERIVDYVLGGNYLDSAGEGFLFSVFASAEHAELARETLGAARTEALGLRLSRSSETTLVRMNGPAGSPMREVAGALAAGAGMPLLRLDCARLLQLNPDPRAGLQRALREAILFQGALLVEELYCKPAVEAGLPNFFLEEAGRLPGVYFIAGCALLPVAASEQHRSFALELPAPDFAGRERLWRRGLAAAGLRPEGVAVEELAAAFRFTAGQIQGAIRFARDEQHYSATAPGEEGGPVAGEDAVPLPAAALFAGCRAVSNQALSDLAVRLPAKFGYDDIVLPRSALRQLFDIENHVRHAETVYGDWGFEERILAGRGLNVLFSGASGTGKTMAASILAGQLRLELFRIDLSTVVSKYIGETEKNLGRIFHEAETSNAILFFDEADALFGKRSEVKDAHDRNANIEVGYLLQRMEEYSGMSILATNLRDNIDEAFLRRLHYIVEFPFPGPTERTLIWDTALPGAAPRGEDLALDFLGERIKLSGGGIKNVALNAAFLAARDRQPISMRHVLYSARREYEKDGRALLPSDLGSYGALLREVEA